MSKKSTYKPNKHHRKSIRLKGYDYAQAGLYFITICCQNRIHRFGHVKNNIMILNEFGTVAYNEWMNTPNIRKNISLGEFIIMPNHMHGIIQILHPSNHRTGELNSPNKNELNSTNKNELNSSNHRIGELNSPNKNELNLSRSRGVCKTPLLLRSPSQTIGAIVRGYKSSVTKQLGLLGLTDKLWQRNYYEHIIRNDQSYHNISKYIINNPAKWTEDKFHSL